LAEVYRFFGIGPSFTGLMETLCNNRTACVIFDDGTCSDPIRLGQGRAQGNGPSPIEYNMGQQILLFKLELDPGINSVYNHFLVPRPVPLSVADQPAAADPGGNVLRNMRKRCFRNESNRETDKTDGFADDCTVITRLEYSSLEVLKNTLVNFGNISGLRCNMEKTSIMLIGPRVPVSEQIQSLGFKIVDRISMLGVVITNNFNDIYNNFEKTIEKMRNTASYWERFNLSLSGRIRIGKSLLLSLVNYVGCFLMPKKPQLDAMQNILNEFSVGKTVVAKNRLYNRVEDNGIGLINLEQFLFAQQAGWVIKAAISARDNWRVDLHHLSFGNPWGIDDAYIEMENNPILKGLAVAFNKVRYAYDNLGNNYVKAFIFNNRLFRRGVRERCYIDMELLGSDFGMENIYKLANLRYEDMFHGNRVKQCIQIEREHSMELRYDVYLTIKGALTYFRNGVGRNRLPSDNLRTFSDLILVSKKHSKVLRNVLGTEARKHEIVLGNQQNIRTFLSISGLQNDGHLLKTVISVLTV
jgi:hypothetical protein